MIELKNGDCLELMKDIEDKSIDLVVTDPPYDDLGINSTVIACVNTNRKFIGMELDEKYFNIAKERIEKELNQLKEE